MLRGTGRFAALLEGESDTAETLLVGVSGGETVLSRRAEGISIGGIRGFLFRCFERAHEVQSLEPAQDDER